MPMFNSYVQLPKDVYVMLVDAALGEHFGYRNSRHLYNFCTVRGMPMKGNIPTQMVVAQHVHSSLLVAPWNFCVDRPVHNNIWQCERVNPHAWWKNNTRPDTAERGMKQTLRGDGYEVADPKDEIPLAMKPGSHGNQADDVFLSFPSKKLGLQSFHKPRECQTAMPVILFILVPQRYWRGVLHYLHPALINCLLCYPFIFVDDIPIFTGSYAPFYPSNHAILVVWVYVKRSNPRWRCRSGSLCTIFCG